MVEAVLARQETEAGDAGKGFSGSGLRMVGKNGWQLAGGVKSVQRHGRIDQAMCQCCGWNGPLVSDGFRGQDLPDFIRCQEIP